MAVLNVLLRYGPLSRREICPITGLTSGAITNIVNDLLESDLAMEVGSLPNPGKTGAGRRRVLVDLKPDGALALGVHLGVRSVLVALGDLRGNLVRQRSIPNATDDAPYTLLKAVAEAASELVAESGGDQRKLLGLGVGCAGLVDPVVGVLKSMPTRGWRDVDVAGYLGSALQLPVAVENNRNAMAIAESTFGRGQKVEDFVLVHVGTIVGAGVVIGHRVHHGNSDAAGQIGHLVVDPSGPRCSCGQRGCLDALVSETAIVSQALRAAMGRRGIPRPGTDGGLLQAEDLFDAAARGDEIARSVVRDAGMYLGRAIGQIIRILSPDMVILVGRIFKTEELVMGPLREAALPESVRALGVSTNIVPSTFGLDLRVIGGVALALQQCLYSVQTAN